MPSGGMHLHVAVAAVAAAVARQPPAVCGRSDRQSPVPAAALAPPALAQPHVVGLPRAPGLLSRPLTHDAVGPFPDAVQLLKLLHAPAPSQLKERGAGSARGVAAGGRPNVVFHTSLVLPTSQSPHGKVPTHLGFSDEEKGTVTLGQTFGT